MFVNKKIKTNYGTIFFLCALHLVPGPGAMFWLGGPLWTSGQGSCTVGIILGGWLQVIATQTITPGSEILNGYIEDSIEELRQVAPGPGIYKSAV